MCERVYTRMVRDYRIGRDIGEAWRVRSKATGEAKYFSEIDTRREEAHTFEKIE